MIGVIAAVGVFLPGCGQEEIVQDKITFMMEDFGGKENMEDRGWLKKLESYTGISFMIHSIPTLDYASYVEERIRSSSLPMVLAANDTVSGMYSFQIYLEQGGFWSIGEYLDDYPNLKSFVGEELWKETRMNGKNYGIPRLRPKPRNGALYRADWAERLNLSLPETMEELYEMLYAFTYLDPDGNGKDDTVGLVNSWAVWGARQWNGIQTITTALGGPNGWKYSEETGEMIPDFSTKEYMETLDWFRKLYEEGIMDRNFAVLTSLQRKEEFEQGKVGMIFSVLDDAQELSVTLNEFEEDARIGILPEILEEGETCKINDSGGYNGFIFFNKIGKGAVKDEETLRRILKFYDCLCSDEGQAVMNLEEEYEEIYEQILPIPAYVERYYDSDLQEEVYDTFEKRSTYLVEDNSRGLYSSEISKAASMGNEKIREASIRYIMGEITEEKYWEAYQEWKENGGEELAKRYKKEYEAKNVKKIELE